MKHERFVKIDVALGRTQELKELISSDGHQDENTNNPNGTNIEAKTI